MFKEAADLAAQLANYPKAIQRYEQVSSFDALVCSVAEQ